MTCRSPPNGSLFGADQVFLGEAGGRTGSLTDGPESFREPCRRDSWERKLWSYIDSGGPHLVINVCSPLMRVSPAAVGARPGGVDSHLHLLSCPLLLPLLLLHPGSFVPPVSSAVAGRRSQPCDGSGWALLSPKTGCWYHSDEEFMHMQVREGKQERRNQDQTSGFR